MLGSYSRRKPLIRGLLALLLAAASWILYRVLEPRGLLWVLWLGAGLLLAWAALEFLLLSRRRSGESARWERWEAAMLAPGGRARAIAEVREEVERASRGGRRMRVRHARLSVVLAELLQAEGRREAAQRALAKVSLDSLEPLQAAVIRRARILAHLRAGSLEDAEEALRMQPSASGDALLDASFASLGLRLRLHRERDPGALEALLEEARSARGLRADADLEAEAGLLEALALRQLGREAEALAALAGLDEEAAARLKVLESEEGQQLLGEALAGEA